MRVTKRVKLLAHTPDPDAVVAMGARMCYSPLEISELKDRVEARDQLKFIRQLMAAGHLSAFEHAVFTFGIEGVSRTLLSQITRHRIASFSVQSQRYVSKSDGFTYVVPPAIEALGAEAAAEFDAQMEQIQKWYDGWRDRLLEVDSSREYANENARFVLPGAAETRMIVTMNARELLHFFSLRCCGRAQWEIRDVAHDMLREAARVAPALFESAGPKCIFGKCPEGNKSCGRSHEVRERIEILIRSAAKEKEDAHGQTVRQ